MSNYLAIATVTEALSLLLASIKNDVSGAVVVAQPPDAVIQGIHGNILNVFLYQVTQNLGYRNQDLPARSSEDGRLTKRPLLGLDLHYIITALGNDDLQAQMVLASAMRILHENPVLTRDLIAQTISSKKILEGSNLADQIELVKVAHQNLSLEEITKLWSSFFQTNYRISTTYQATVVLLESKKETKPTFPVLEPKFKVIQFKQPIIQKVTPQILEFNPGGETTLTIEGLNFQADDVTVQIGDEKTVTPTSLSDAKITLAIPADTTSGVKTIQIIHSLKLGLDGKQVRNKIFKSNIAAFVLAPKITKVNDEDLVSSTPTKVSKDQQLTLKFLPAAAPSQKVSLIVGEYEIVLPKTTSKTPTGTLSVALSSNTLLAKSIADPKAPKTYLLRIRVDDAESQLGIDADKASATFGQFVWPAITVT
jgi:hypothetical protein